MMQPDDPKQHLEQQNEVCERLRPELKAYVDGQAGWWQRQSIGRHLTKCAECREETAAMREFSAKWRRADDEVLDPNLRARILAAVPDTSPAHAKVTAPSRLRHRALALAGAGASAVIGAALLFPMWQRNARVESEDAAKTSLSAPGAVMGAVTPATESSAAHTEDGAAANVAAPSAQKRSIATSSALPSKAKQMQIADARAFDMDKTADATAAAETSGPGGSSSVSQDAAGESAVASAPSVPAVTAKSAALPPAAKPSLPNSANMPSAPGGGTAAEDAAHNVSHADNKTDKPAVNSKFDKSKPDSYAAKSKSPTDSDDREKNTTPQRTQEASQTVPAAIARRARHALSPGGEVTPVAPQLAAPRSAPIPSPRSYGYGRIMTPDNTDTVLLKISVAHIETATASIERDIRAAGGSVVSSATQTDADGTKSATLLLKAPRPSLNAFLAQAEQTGTTLLKSVPPVPAVPSDTSPAHAVKRRTNAPAPKEGRGQKAYTNVTIRLLNRKETP